MVWRFNAVASGLIIIAIFSILRHLWFSNPQAQMVTIGTISVVFLGTGVELMLLRTRYRHYRYEVDGQGLRIRRGYLLARYTSIPASQILYIDMRQGPIARRLGLSGIQIGTLGSTHDLGPLNVAQAREIAGRFGVSPRHAPQ